MLYKISCPHCGGRISFEEDAAEKTVACPHCQQTLPLSIGAAEMQPVTGTAGSKSSVARKWGFGLAAVAVAGAMAVGVFFYFKDKPVEVTEDTGITGIVMQDGHLTVEVSPKNENLKVANNRGVQVTLRRDFPVAAVYLCDVSFATSKPAPAEVDRIVRESLEQCVKADSTHRIVGMAFWSNQPLSQAEYTGPLVWTPEENKIQKLSEARLP